MSVEQMAIVLHHSRARGTDKLVLVGIANHDGDGGAWPTVETLARYANVDERSIRSAFARLKLLGELNVELNAGGGRHTRPWERPNLYEIRVTCPWWCDGSKHHRLRDDLTQEELDQLDEGRMPTSARGRTPTSSPPRKPTSGGARTSSADREDAHVPPGEEAHVRRTVLQTVQNSGVDEEPSTPRRRKRAAHSDVWAALLDVCRIDETEATGSAMSAWQRATASLRRAGATPDQIRTRAAAFRTRWPQATLTPTALERRWAEIPSTAPTGRSSADPIDLARGQARTLARSDCTEADLPTFADPTLAAAFTEAFHVERARLAERSSA